jgi:transcription initiation factor TFIIIB Brf1 subunit/transcription initiation factor TFIIB
MPDKIQESRSEWRPFSSNDNNNNVSRTGAPSSFAGRDRGLCSIIGRVGKGASPNRIDI